MSISIWGRAPLPSRERQFSCCFASVVLTCYWRKVLQTDLHQDVACHATAIPAIALHTHTRGLGLRSYANSCCYALRRDGPSRLSSCALGPLAQGKTIEIDGAHRGTGAPRCIMLAAAIASKPRPRRVVCGGLCASVIELTRGPPGATLAQRACDPACWTCPGPPARVLQLRRGTTRVATR